MRGVVFLLFLLLLGCSASKPYLGIQAPGLADFRQSKSPLGEFSFSKGNATVRIGVVGEMSIIEAQKQMKTRAEQIAGLYASIPSPYPGVISNEIVCGDEFKPHVVRDNTSLFIEGYTTPRGTFGACSWDLIAHRTYLKYIYCKGKLLFIQENIPYHSKDATSMIKGARCSK